MTTNLTIKQVRKELKRWGDFWLKKELGRGFKTQSISETFGKSQNVGSLSDSLYVPHDIEQLTHRISCLRSECIRAIRAKYMTPGKLADNYTLVGFETKRSAEFWLVKAEQSILQMLSNDDIRRANICH